MKLGRYEIIREISKGSTGVVYLAKDPLIGRLVALKTIQYSSEMDDEDIKERQQRFVREAQAGGIVSHPAVAKVHDIGEDADSGVSYIAMEFVEGADLRRSLTAGRAPSFAQTADIIAQVADALDAIHAKGIVHRDVKPANIFVADEKVKLAGFGVAKIISSGAALTRTGQLIGTPHYMAPEQVRGTPVDGRTDIFSLGICLYECLTRRKPFEGESLTSISYKIVHEDPPRLRDVDANIPEEFEEIVARCLAKDPAKRFQRARDLARALRAMAQDERLSTLKPAAGPVIEAMIETVPFDQTIFRRHDVSESWDDSSLQADAREQRGREQLSRHAYERALNDLSLAMELDPRRAPRINAELGFLFASQSPFLGDTAAMARLRWCTDVWSILTKAIPGNLHVPPAVAAPLPADAPASTAAARPEQTVAPQVKGEELEDAALRLFRRFFALAEEDERNLRVQLNKLRKQKAGAQFGYDLAFEASVAGRGTVRCHVECKNYSSPITLKDIADKLLQQKSHGVKIDHWILISPHAEAAQDLHHFLEFENASHDFPFDIHLWCPETKVEELFGLEPTVHDRFYPNSAADKHPRTWPAAKKSAVVDRYRQLLRPVYRLPPGWQDYIDTERHLCFSDAERFEFERTYRQFVPLGVKDPNGVELRGSAVEHLQAWLAQKDPREAFVLGEFGDGKSFLTYTLCRQLLRDFRADPTNGIVPIRLALRELKTARTVREFLQARLELFSADLAGWAALKGSYKTLVILDGFDEISKELDPRTITSNILALLDCCNAPIFDGCKILITSRTHFFETGDAARLLQRLDKPLQLQLGRIPRGQVLGHLQDVAERSEERDLVQKLSQMHDPIGLGTKPLFLQMLKDTLHELPPDLDEVSLYELYAKKSLDRKIDMLDDPEVHATRGDTIQQLLGALGIIAQELQCSKEPYVSLKTLVAVTGPFAELLWKLTGDEQLESDAQARIGTRSLLSRVRGLESYGDWLVDFCHRSIREYFVARRFVGFLGRSVDDAARFLHRVPLNHEILYFTSCLLRRSRDPQVLGNLRELMTLSVAGQDTHALAGKALTILLRVVPVLPRDIDYRRRNFDFADLEDGDLSALDFSGSSFRGANFANANLEGANLSYCDLSDVRLHETTAVRSVAASSPSQIFAAYEDGTIWEWNLEGGGKPNSRIVFAEQGLKLSRLGVTKDGVPWGVSGREAVLFDRSPAEWRCSAKIPLQQKCSDFHVDENTIAMLITDEHTRCLLGDLEQQKFAVEVSVPESSTFVASKSDLLCYRSGDTTVSLVGNGLSCTLNVGNATSVHAAHRATGEIAVVVGESDGALRVFTVAQNGGFAEAKPLFADVVHSGPILSVMFCDGETVASGGLDRMIGLTPFRGTASPQRKLQLSVRCSGLDTTGLKPESQRIRLDELKARSL